VYDHVSSDYGPGAGSVFRRAVKRVREAIPTLSFAGAGTLFMILIGGIDVHALRLHRGEQGYRSARKENI
jgi:hypothetical protein